jgi:hypothetical protein
MSALNTLQFNGYTLRPAGPGDLKLAENWTAWDADHAGQIDPRFWLEQRPAVDSVLVLDGKGPVFFFKTALLHGIPQEEKNGFILKIHENRYRAQVFIQFMPCATEEDRERTREALIQGMEWLEPVLALSGAEEIFFDSGNEKLIAFCVKRLGFEFADGFLKKATPGMKRLRKKLA